MAITFYFLGHSSHLNVDDMLLCLSGGQLIYSSTFANVYLSAFYMLHLTDFQEMLFLTFWLSCAL